ncbi:hypothetical protein SFOMI_2793 [Sphingobium fuliginis]|uniref:Uncharacterized protein n=1 Tax=Sphingobium fuliginis (strain ATCC 27551) TaxID=336203 RepID=A0A292ZFI3_SPHSA|nr:hypothetical protein SFOMI_2793 [Sphingobium fuliginis]
MPGMELFQPEGLRALLPVVRLGAGGGVHRKRDESCGR